ncbi:MAG: hypothetical protein NT013_26170 [Planctomycetia bacterium]|nr:hypothetical protein [Planctomycetia bacterium]
MLSDCDVGQELKSLGANVLMLLKDATLQDYYSSDRTLPELHGGSILLWDLPDVEVSFAEVVHLSEGRESQRDTDRHPSTKRVSSEGCVNCSQAVASN